MTRLRLVIALSVALSVGAVVVAVWPREVPPPRASAEARPDRGFHVDGHIEAYNDGRNHG